MNNINKAYLYFSLFHVFVLLLGCRQLKSRPQQTRSSTRGPHRFSLRAEGITVVSGLRKEPRLTSASFHYFQPSELEGKASQLKCQVKGSYETRKGCYGEKNRDYPPEKASGKTKSSQQKAITRDSNEPTEKQEIHRKHTHGVEKSCIHMPMRQAC